MLEEQFNEYKAEYSRIETTEERKSELIVLMQSNLKNRSSQEGCTVDCLDGREYSLDSKNVEHLYAIDAFLRFEKRKNQQSAISDTVRQQAQNRNNYGPNNPYRN